MRKVVFNNASSFKNLLFWILAIPLLLNIQSCKIYSFSGANINPDIKSISIAYFNNDSGNGPPIMSDLFTNSLREKMINNTTLRLENFGGDVEIDGAIVGYNYSIQAPTGQQSSDLRRITMTVSVNFTNHIDPDDSFENLRISKFADYEVTQSLEAVEEGLIREINDLIIDEIFNKAFVKW